MSELTTFSSLKRGLIIAKTNALYWQMHVQKISRIDVLFVLTSISLLFLSLLLTTNLKFILMCDIAVIHLLFIRLMPPFQKDFQFACSMKSKYNDLARKFEVLFCRGTKNVTQGEIDDAFATLAVIEQCEALTYKNTKMFAKAYKTVLNGE